MGNNALIRVITTLCNVTTNWVARMATLRFTQFVCPVLRFIPYDPREKRHSFLTELPRIHGKSAHLANCQLFKNSFEDKL